MEFSFDIRGNLKPYEKSTLDFSEFKQFFVEKFTLESTRHAIFKQYQRFIEDFANQVAPDFTHWIDGSFVTNRTNPRDIDVVTIIDYQIFELKEALIEQQFRLRGAQITYGVDAYTVRKYPEGHRKYLNYQNELIYWDNWFSWTKRNRVDKKFQKGYIEIFFNF